MELEFTSDQEELRDGVHAMLARECPISLVRALVEDDVPTDGLWKQMAELGWPALTVPENLGGLGLGPVELAVVVEELGRVLAPGPFVPTVTQFVPVLREIGTEDQQARFLAGVAAVTTTGTLAITEPGSGVDPATVRATADRNGDGWTLHGTKHGVLGAPEVDEVVVVARVSGTQGDDGVAAFIVPTAELDVAPIAGFDPTRPLATISLDGTLVPGDRVLGDPGPATAAALRRAIEHGVVALALEAVGTCQTIFDITLEYAKQREQFGVPIGSFQAIKHKLANMLVALERARATGYFAALTIAEDDDRRAVAVSTAKVAAGDCQQLLAQDGIQILGGIGYTWEHDMHLYARRVKTDAQLLGTTAEHRARIGDLLGI
ncbi:MAG: acyl-CoA/acyl-ACP dehydrogenase [Acidimicrobiia bacterium]|nr:acyl-CoA/acyl-ACP dehydrogenase [Acidimicrobiia bacterium]